jgi:hypothetical protein
VNSGDWIISWSVRLALLLLVVVQALEFQSLRQGRIASVLRWLWTTAFVLFAIHVAAAFHFVHGWSHQTALEATAKETFEKMGFSFGAGIYFNYLFLLVWATDLVWIWRATGLSTKSQQMLFYAGRAYMLFIAFNGVVVFKSGWMRFLGILATVLLMALWWRGLRRTKVG